MGRLFRALPVLALLGACSDLDGLSEPAPDDAGKPGKDGGGGQIDAGTEPGDGAIPDGPRCDTTKPFDAPTLMTAFDPTVNFVKAAIASPDELEVFYLRLVAGKWELRHARRAKKSDAWGPVETMAMNPPPSAYLSLSAGGLKLYFWNIDSPHLATRIGNADNFGVPTKFDVPNGPGAFVVSSDDAAYFGKTQTLSDGGCCETLIRRGSLSTYGYSTGATPIPNVHKTGFNDEKPALNTSETAMYFSSNRPGGKGLADIWVSRRSSKSEELGTPVHVPELSTDEFDVVTWVADDECEVFLDRASHVYHARRPK